jgi:hypothetical protein
MAPREVTWEELWPLGGWAPIFNHYDVQLVMWSRARDASGYRIEADGFLPAVLVLPADWRLRLPPLAPSWTISREA